MAITSRLPDALAYVRRGRPAFEVGMCKRQTRQAFGVPSDGSDDAAEAWGRTLVRVAGNQWIPGMLLWWLGGAGGHGHVAFADHEVGWIWTVDYPVAGHWNRVPMDQLERAWPNLRYAGASLDIDGVQVVPRPVPKMPRINNAIRELEVARDARKPGPARRKIRDMLAQLRAFKRGEYL